MNAERSEIILRREGVGRASAELKTAEARTSAMRINAQKDLRTRSGRESFLRSPSTGRAGTELKIGEEYFMRLCIASAPCRA